MALHEEVEDTVRDAGFTPRYIEKQVEELEEELEQRGVDLAERDVLVGYDMNGPITRKDLIDFTPHKGVKEAVHTIPFQDGIEGSLVSGWDIATLGFVRDERLEMPGFGLVGELGSVYEFDDEIHQVTEAPYDHRNRLMSRMIDMAADRGLKLHEQGNVSPVVGATYVESDGTEEDPRGNIRNHPLFEETTTGEIYERIQGRDGFYFENGRVYFENTPGNMDALRQVLTTEFPLVGLRYGTDEDKVYFERDPRDQEFELEDVHGFLDGVTADTEFEPDHNPDWNSDYELDVETSKELGANSYARRAFNTDSSEDYFIFNIGDKEGDILSGENALFVAQEGYPAEGAAPEAPTAIHAGDYSLALAELLYRNKV